MCAFYHNADDDKHPLRQIEYPFRNYFLDQNGNTKYFSYQKQVEDKRLSRGLLDGTPVYIKFSHRYSEAAHRAAQLAHLAPRLFSVEEIHGWYVVVMEDLSNDYEPLSDVNQEDSSLQQNVEDAVHKLHGLKYVHGDIRRVNILVRKPGCKSDGLPVAFVDWDWSGKIGEVCYPHNMNPAIKRSKDAVVGTKIKEEHDLDMVSFCFDST